MLRTNGLPFLDSPQVSTSWDKTTGPHPFPPLPKYSAPSLSDSVDEKWSMIAKRFAPYTLLHHLIPNERMSLHAPPPFFVSPNYSYFILLWKK